MRSSGHSPFAFTFTEAYIREGGKGYDSRMDDGSACRVGINSLPSYLYRFRRIYTRPNIYIYCMMSPEYFIHIMQK